LVTNQVEVSLTETKAFYDGTIDQMMMKKLQPMAWSVMGTYFSEDSERTARIKSVLGDLTKNIMQTKHNYYWLFAKTSFENYPNHRNVKSRKHKIFKKIITNKFRNRRLVFIIRSKFRHDVP
jgi:hypothetical protein